MLHDGSRICYAYSDLRETRLRDSIMAADEAPTIVTRRLENLDEVLNGVRRFEEHYDGADLALDFVRSATLIRNEEDDEELDE